MKVGLITDTHFGARNDKVEFYGYFERLFKDFFDEVDRRGIERIVHLGDLYDRRNVVNYRTAQKARELFLNEIDKRGIETDIIAGNHDVYYKDTNQINALHELVEGRYKTITTHIEPAIISIDHVPIQLLPWIPNSDNAKFHEAIETARAPILLAHLELMDFEMFGGVVQTHGMDRSLFNRFDLVCSGHYHHPSVRDNIHYLGAFAELIWSDYNDPRGWSILDTDTRSLEFIPNKHTMFATFTYDDVNKSDMKSEIDGQDFSGKFVKMLVENKADSLKFNLAFDRIAAQNPVEIKVIEGSTIEAISEEEEESVSGEDTMTILSKYMDGLTLTVDHDRMKTFMRELYLEAVSVETVGE